MNNTRKTALHGIIEWNPDTLGREINYSLYTHYRPYTALRLSLEVPKESTILVKTFYEYHSDRYEKTNGVYPWYAERAQTFHGLYALDLSGRMEILVWTKKRTAQGDPDHRIEYYLDPEKRRPVRWPLYKKMVLRLIEHDELTETSPVIPPPPAQSPAPHAPEPDYPPNSLFTE